MPPGNIRESCLADAPLLSLLSKISPHSRIFSSLYSLSLSLSAGLPRGPRQTKDRRPVGRPQEKEMVRARNKHLLPGRKDHGYIERGFLRGQSPYPSVSGERERLSRASGLPCFARLLAGFSPAHALPTSRPHQQNTLLSSFGGERAGESLGNHLVVRARRNAELSQSHGSHSLRTRLRPRLVLHTVDFS